MSILATCRCGQSFQAPEEVAGQTLPCPMCGQDLFIPAAAAPLTTTTLPSRLSWTSRGQPAKPGVNWGLIAALAGCAGALLLVVLAVSVIAWNSFSGEYQASAGPQVPSADQPPGGARDSSSSLSLPAGPQIQIGPIGAAPEPPQPRTLPASKPPDLPAGQIITLAGGRFTVWVPTQQPLAEKTEGSGEDLFRYYDLTAAGGASLRVMATFGSNAEHTRHMIQAVRELSGRPRSILEEPSVAIEFAGVLGTVTEKNQQRYTKASRRREFFHEGVGLVYWATGSDEQVNCPEIDWFFASLRFGPPDP